MASLQPVPKMLPQTRIDKTRTIGIIGGAGKMGRYFVRICKQNGYDNLRISDPNTSAVQKMVQEFHIEQGSNIDIARESDITIVSVPIAHTLDAIKEVGPDVKQGSLFAHFTSVQAPAMAEMAQFAQCDHMGIHIMAAPSDNLKLVNTNVVLVPGSNNPVWTDYIRNFFSETDARVCIADAQTHDLCTALIQAQVHINKFLFGYVLRRARKDYGLELKQIELLRTPLFLFDQLSLGRMLVSGNPDMYADIQMQNPTFLQTLEWLRQGLDSYTDIVGKRDKNAFRSMFEKLASYFGSYHTAWAKVDSDHVIQGMKASFESHVDDHKKSMKAFYETQLTRAANESGALRSLSDPGANEKTMRNEVVKFGSLFASIGYFFNIGDYREIGQLAKELLTLAKRSENYFAHSKELKSAIESFIKMCAELEKMRSETIGI